MSAKLTFNAALSFIASGPAWPAGAGIWWLIGGILQGSVIPFTLIFIMPTNNELLAPSLDKGSDKMNEQLSPMGSFACGSFRTRHAGAADLLVSPDQSMPPQRIHN
jgi:hypothetical protein